MMTPYDSKILLMVRQGIITPGANPSETADLLRTKMPNVAGVILRTSHGVSWQGRLARDKGVKAVTGVRRVADWVEAFGERGLEVHAWGAPRLREADDLDTEAERLAAAAAVWGIRSLLIEIKQGEDGWMGTPEQATELMERVRAATGRDVHIGLMLDGRHNRPFDHWVEPWLPFVGSLHPTVFPIAFGRDLSVEQHLNIAFNNLGAYMRPIYPVLQMACLGDRPTPEEITQQGLQALAHGASGLAYFRLGIDRWEVDGQPHTGDSVYDAVAAIHMRAPGLEELAPAYTWQDVINATNTVAVKAGQGDQWWAWFAHSNVPWAKVVREAPYSGVPVEQWPIDADIRKQILDLLQLPSDDLVRVTSDAQDKQARDDKTATAQRRQQRGSIVGIHGAPGAAAPKDGTWDDWIRLLHEMGVRWYKQCDVQAANEQGKGTIFAWVIRLKQEGIEPIVRFLKSDQFPDSLDDYYFDKMRLYAQHGIVWAEIGNEPNLDIEWRGEWRNRDDHKPMQHNNPEVIRAIAETWVRDARRTLDAGMRPAFYAFAPTDWKGNFHPLYSSVFFQQKVVAYLAANRRQETIDIFRRGGWIAVHSATYEQPVDFDPRQPGAVWDMTLRSYEVVLDAFRQHFGGALNLDEIPVMSTEGGVFTPESTSMNGHTRLSSNEEHARRVTEMYRWLERHSPLQAMCPWCISVGPRIGHWHEGFRHDGWIEQIGDNLQPRPVIAALRQLRDEQEAAESALESLALAQLDLPYISQFDPSAAKHTADCGPTCLAMILNAGRAPVAYVTVDQLYDKYDILRAKIGQQGAAGYTNIGEMKSVAAGEGLSLSDFYYVGSGDAWTNLQNLINRGTPFIALVNYGRWPDSAKANNFFHAHFVVVVGYDERNVYMHDPLFRGPERRGQYLAMDHATFLSGWGANAELGNSDYAALVTDKQVGWLSQPATGFVSGPSPDQAEAAGFRPSIDLDHVAPGQNFQGTWTFRNVGTSVWTGNYRLAFTETVHAETRDYPRSPMSAVRSVAIGDVGAPAQVNPGETVSLTVNFTAPNTAATHATNWQLQTPDGRPFGPVRWMRAVVETAGAPVVTPPTPVKPVPKPTRARFEPGMNINPGVHQPDVDRLRGLSWVRYVFIAADRRQSIDEAFNNIFGPLMRTYAEANIKSLIILNHETEHGNVPWQNGDWATYAGHFGRAARRVAELCAPLGNKVAFQIWNEQDSGWSHDKGNPNPSARGVRPEDYALLLDAAARNIREVAPQATVVAGGLKTGPFNGVAYLEATRKTLGGRLPVDAIACHPYGRYVKTDPFYEKRIGTLEESINIFTKAFPNFPLWITEVGIPGHENVIGPEHYDKIALYMREFVTEVADRFADKVPVLIWFAWTDRMENAGILTADGREKPGIFEAFKLMKSRGVLAAGDSESVVA